MLYRLTIYRTLYKRISRNYCLITKMSDHDEKRCYKKFLQSGEFVDIPRDTLRRVFIKKFEMMRNTVS